MKSNLKIYILFISGFLFGQISFSQQIREPFFLPNPTANFPMQIPSQLDVPMMGIQNDLTVNGILDFGTHKVAIINQKSYRLNEVITYDGKKWLLAQIGVNDVKLRYQRETKTLKFK